MKPIATTLLLCSLLALSAAAKERERVTMPDSIQVEGKSLSLVGMGLRTKVIFKVYVAGLYVEHPSRDAQAVIAADEVKRVHLVMLRNLSRDQIIEAIHSGFEKNLTAAQLAALKSRMDKFDSVVRDLKEKEEFLVTYVPGKGVLVNSSGGQQSTVEGKDFGDAIFSVWLGKEPVDGALKKQLLGGD